MARKRKATLSKAKACKMLHEKKAKTDKQRRFFGARCSGKPRRR